MKLYGNGEGYLIAYNSAPLGKTAELIPMGANAGQLLCVQKHQFNPTELNGPAEQTLWFKLLTGHDPLYVLDYWVDPNTKTRDFSST